MSQPVPPPADEVPEPDDVLVTDPDSLPDVFLEAPDAPTDEEELGDELGIEDVDDIPELPGGDFLNRRSRFPAGGPR